MREFFDSPVRQFVKRGMRRALPRALFTVSGRRRGKCWFLTFDDGPHPEFTPLVLDALAADGALATFFVVGRRARLEPALIRRIAREGHSLGHHSFEHLPADQCSVRQLAQEVRQTRELLRDITGVAPRLFRPPFGKLSPAKLLSLWAMGQTVALWSVDPRDYEVPSPEQIVDWFRTRTPRAGDIVLMHDNHPRVAPALPAILQQVRESGLIPSRL